MPTLDHHAWGRGVWATYRLWCYRNTHLSEPHDHTFYELFWVESGQGQYWINGKHEVLRAGDLVLVRPEDRHCFAAAKAGEFMEFVNVAFLPRVWTGIQTRYFDGRGVYFGIKNHGARRHRLSPPQVARLGTLSAGLRSGGRSRLVVEAFIAGLLSMLEEPRRPRQSSRVPDWLELAASQIRLHPNFAGGPASFARLAGRSPEHVARACRKYLGCAPSRLVNEARMEFAARELVSGNKPIVEIALECGIENLGHFYQLFRKKHGLAPALYRRENQGPKLFN